jgi:hypothetical protein
MISKKKMYVNIIKKYPLNILKIPQWSYSITKKKNTSIILFDNKAKIEWERDIPIKRKMKKNHEPQLSANQTLKDKLKKIKFKN